MRYLTLFIAFCFLASNIYFVQAQETDTSKTEDEDEYWDNFAFEDDDDFWDWDFDFFDKDKAVERHKPTVELQYGFTNPTYHKDVFSGKFSKNFEIDLRLGFSDLYSAAEDPDILDYSFKYFYLKNISADFGSVDKKQDEVEVQAWRFGFSTSDGYGYRLGDHGNILLYHDNGIGWTKLDFKDTVVNQLDQQALDLFGDAIRFGDNFEGGIKVRIIKPLALNMSYERSLVYPRHMFWYWVASGLIEEAGHGMISYFVGEILESSPEVAPVVNFVLKNSLSYGFYELRKKRMNWPIETVPPMMFDGFKIGITFIF